MRLEYGSFSGILKIKAKKKLSIVIIVKKVLKNTYKLM
jgi:hypothetical protein